MGKEKKSNKSVNKKSNNKSNKNSKKVKKQGFQPSRPLKAFLLFVEVIQLITAIGFMAYFYNMNMWPTKYLGYVLAAVIIVMIISWILKHWKWGCVLSVLISLTMIGVQCYGCHLIYITNNTLSEITEKNDKKTDVVCVIVMADDPAKRLEDAKDYSFGALSELDKENTDDTINWINERTNSNIKVTEYDNFLTLAAVLYEGKEQAIILNHAYIDVLKDFDGYDDFRERTRIISSHVITHIVQKPVVEEETTQPVEEQFSITKDTFNVYISGIDTTGDVTTKSRSDVNIIMSVNPTTKQVLLVSTPRDYYVPLSISKGVKDKLTHAGLYGVDVSMETLEMLYGIDIDYFVRMNFTGFTDIIDILGGVKVYSEYSFSVKGYSFKAGYNTLRGDAALVFARERKSFASGDNQRGKNQMEVIKAVIDKAQSSSMLTEFSAILDKVSDCMQTNMSTAEISQLVKMQLDSGAEWNIESYAVTGSGQSQYTYTVPSARAYVMVPHEDKVEEAKQLFKTVAEGGILRGKND